MLQQINLYRGLKKLNVMLSCQQIMLIIAAFFVVLVVISIYMIIVYYEAVFKVHILQVKQENLNKGLVYVKKGIPTVEAKENMEIHLKEIQEEKLYKQKMYATLKQLRYQDSAGLVSYLNSLAEQTMTDVWLTRFRLYNNGASIVLEGCTMDSSNVPKYVEALGKTQMFSGKSFDKLQISLDEKNKQIKFIIGTE